MPDITMCKDETCPQRQECYRFVARPTPHWQAYYAGSPRTDEGCDYFLRVYGKAEGEHQQRKETQ